MEALPESLLRRVRGLINRMTPGTVEGVVEALQSLYGVGGATRGQVHRAISTQLLDAAERAVHTSGYPVAFGAAAAALGGKVGVDAVAEVVGELVRRVERGVGGEGEEGQRSLVVVLCTLYHMGVVAAPLLLGGAGRMAEGLSDGDVEALLVLVQCGGRRLRGEDPLGVKGLIEAVQRGVGGDPEEGSRREYALTTLYDLKNNRMDATAPFHAHLSLIKGVPSLSTPLQVGWGDLLTRRGDRWWVVGADSLPPSAAAVVADADTALLREARTHRMTSAVKKAVFVALRGAEDAVDGVHRIQRLQLRPRQDREVVLVALYLCAAETAYNPFYAAVLARLCATNRNYRYSLRFALWDRFRDLEVGGVTAAYHTGCLVADVVRGGVQGLGVIKALPYGEMLVDPAAHPRARTLLEALFLRLFAARVPDEEVATLIGGVCKAPSLTPLREGLVAYLPVLAEGLKGPMGAAKRAGDREGFEEYGVVRKRLKRAKKVIQRADEREWDDIEEDEWERAMDIEH